MAGRKLYDDSSSTMIVPLQNQKLSHSSELVESLMVHNHSSKPSFQGSKSMVNVVNVGDMGVINNPFYQAIEKEENNDDDDDHVENFEVCLSQPGKKRRLTNEQVHFLESSFEVENKLEPKRKVQLAKKLGLKPRQVAIWFQNRRARFKTKQLEKDYCSLKASYDILKVDYDSLFQENNKLKQEVNSLKNELVPTEEEEYNLVDKSLDGVRSQHKMHMDLILNVTLENGSNSAKSDVIDSESPHKTDGNNSSIMEPANSSHVIEPNQSEFSQDEESNLLAVSFLPKVEDAGCYDEPPENSCCFQFPFEDQTFYFWSN